MKYALLVGLIALFGLLGFGVSSSYIERKKFFFEFDKFIKNLASNISFYSKKLTDILGEFKPNVGKNLSNLISNFLNLIEEQEALNKKRKAKF